MTAKGRIHAIRLSEKIKKNPEFAAKVGIRSEIRCLSESITNKKLKAI